MSWRPEIAAHCSGAGRLAPVHKCGVMVILLLSNGWDGGTKASNTFTCKARRRQGRYTPATMIP
jgi:hypothetical protein